jgi:hypothetical protein
MPTKTLKLVPTVSHRSSLLEFSAKGASCCLLGIVRSGSVADSLAQFTPTAAMGRKADARFHPRRNRTFTGTVFRYRA